MEPNANNILAAAQRGLVAAAREKEGQDIYRADGGF